MHTVCERGTVCAWECVVHVCAHVHAYVFVCVCVTVCVCMCEGESVHMHMYHSVCVVAAKELLANIDYV